MRVYELAAFAAADQAAARGVSELIQFACWRPGASSIARIAAAVSSPTMKETAASACSRWQCWLPRRSVTGGVFVAIPGGASNQGSLARSATGSGTLTWLVIGWHGLVGDLGELAGRRALGGRFQR